MSFFNRQSAARFFNPFSGKSEEYTTPAAAVNSMLQAAAERINRLDQEVKDLKGIVARKDGPAGE